MHCRSWFLAKQYLPMAALGLLFLFSSALSQAQITPLGDSYTNSADPTSNYGATPLLYVNGAAEIVYIQFPLSSIPAGASVSQATLKLYVNGVTTAGSFNVDYVNGAWAESTIDASNAPALGTTIVSNVSITSADKNQYILINLTPAVQAWLSGSETNDGIALVANSTFNASFDSKENPGTSHPAELDIAYAGGDGTITGVTTTSGSGLTGGGTSGTLSLGLTSSCATNQVLQWSGSAWACASVGTGTVTGVTAGTDLTGGGTSGNVTLNLNTTLVPLLAAANTFTGVNYFNGASNALVASTSGQGSVGLWGVANATSGGSTGVLGYTSDGSGAGVEGTNLAASGGAGGVYGVTNDPTGAGVFGFDISSYTGGTGVYGSVSGDGTGVYGTSTIGVAGDGSNAPSGSGSNGGLGVYAAGGNGDPSSDTEGGNGMRSFGGGGARGGSDGTGGVFYGGSKTANGDGIFSEEGSGIAGYFLGNVQVTGTVSQSVSLSKIDHPLDPANKYLYHSFVESPDMKNIYDGVATLDANGEAAIQMPEWFGVLNRDFRYQLTCIGGFAPVYIAEKLANNQFKIGGGKPSMEVSWQITGIRQDAWANAHRIPVEEEKEDRLKGFYIHPELYGAPAEKQIEWARHPEMMKRIQQQRQAMKEKLARPVPAAALLQDNPK
jgi:hypothetical protein